MKALAIEGAAGSSQDFVAVEKVMTWDDIASPTALHFTAQGNAMLLEFQHPYLHRCKRCELVIGFKRRVFRCSCCGEVVCHHCIEDVKGVQWCGYCELKKSLSLGESARLFSTQRSKREGESKSYSYASSPNHNEPNSSPTSTSSQSPQGNGRRSSGGDSSERCALCSSEFGFFSSRRKYFCGGCSRSVCDKCSHRMRAASPSSERSGSSSRRDDGSGLTLSSLVSKLKETMDPRLCVACLPALPSSSPQ